MEELILARLRASAGLTGLLSHINWGGHPQGARWPGVVLNLVGGAGGHNLSGATGQTSSRVQIDCYAETFGGAKLISRAVLDTLDGWRDGIVQGVFLAAMRDDREGNMHADQPFRASLDFRVHHRRLI